jgi:hypothetical protein
MCNPITTQRPDALLDKGTHAGYEWEITHNGGGYRCGYVRLPAGHPWHGLDRGAVPADAHGGLTFAQPDTHCGKGGADDAWWIGFDCSHLGDGGDLPDPELPNGDVMADTLADACARAGLAWTGTIKTTAYVRDRCAELCEQARRACG